MSEPLRRISKYMELLQELVRCTHEDHADHAEVNKALSMLKDINKFVRESQSARDNHTALLRIEDSIRGMSGKIVDQERAFLRSSPLLKVCRKVNKEFVFWLFSDILIYGHYQSPNSFKHHRTIQLSTCSIANVGETDGRGSFAIISKSKSFVVIVPTLDDLGHSLKNVKGPYTELPDVRSPSESIALRDSWVADLRTHCGGGSGGFVAAPVWQADKNAACCPLCQKPFTPARRRHHCRICGTLCCAACSKHRVLIPEIDDKRRCASAITA